MTQSLTLLEMTIRMARQAMQRAFDRMGIEVSLDQWQLMMLISENESCSQRKLADLSGKDPASITRMMDMLERAQWVERKAVEGNRRQFGLGLTRKGKGLLKAYQGFVEELHDSAFTDFSKGEKETLNALLLRVQGNISEQLD